MAILNVGFDKPFITIMAAYAAANSGDTLLIDEGMYRESITLSSNKYVNLVGNTLSPEKEKVVIVSPINTNALYIDGLTDACTIIIENITFRYIYDSNVGLNDALSTIYDSLGANLIFNRCHLDTSNKRPNIFYYFEDAINSITFNNCRLTFQEVTDYNYLGPAHFVMMGKNVPLYFNKCILSAQVDLLHRCTRPLISDYVINKESIGFGPAYGTAQLLPIKYYFKGSIVDDLSANIKVPTAAFEWADKVYGVDLSPDKLAAIVSKDNCDYYYLVRTNVGKTSGKWYWEIKLFGGTNYNRYGVATDNAGRFSNLGTDMHSWAFIVQLDLGKYLYSNICTDNYIDDTKEIINDHKYIIGVALDMDRGYIWWSVNGEWLYDGDPSIGKNPAFTNLKGKIFPAASLYSTYNLDSSVKFFVDPADLSYDVPDGFAPYSTEMIWRVKCINAVTNEIEGYTMSDPVTKEYYLETTYSGAHFVICEDPAEMPDFNDVLLGRLIPERLN